METVIDILPALLEGSLVTLQLALASTVLGGLLSFGAGIGKLSSNLLVRTISVIYVEIFRGTSLLVQMFWLFFALPLVGLTLSPVLAGILALSLNIGAYGAEVVRGAIQSVGKGQYEAAVALNFSKRYRLWHIILPQAIVEMMPPFGNLVVQNLKDTALVSLITLSDLTFRAQNIRNLTLESMPVYSTTLILYFIMALLFIAVMRWLERFIAHKVGVAQGRARA